MALLKSTLQLGQDEMPFEGNLIMEGKAIIEVEYCMLELVDMALGHRIEPPSSDLNAKPLNSSDVDKRLALIVKLTDAQHHAQLLATFYGQPIKVYSCKCNKIASHGGEVD